MLLSLGMLGAQAQTLAVPSEHAGEAARLIAEVMIVGRDIVSRHQTQINDPDGEDKGFSGDYFRRALSHEFERSTGQAPERIEHEGVRDMVLASIDAAVAAVERSQAMINAPDRAFKGFIPALFGRLTGQILASNSDIVIKQTTFLPRNSYNTPDAYELGVLARFRDSRPKAGSGELLGNRFRYMTPLYIDATCLQCHGEPKGSLDMAGRAMEGYKLGELRGAISIDLPVR